MFLWRKGIEFYLIDDSEKTLQRQQFLTDLVDSLKLPLYFDDIWHKGARSGEVLLYMRPWGNGYSFRYYSADQFEPYYDDDNHLERVVIRSTIEKPDGDIERVIELRRDRVEVWEGRNPEQFTPDFSMMNPYGFVPAVVVQNKACIGARGASEFEWLKGQIEQHDWQVDQIHGNVEFFGGPIFYSSRSQTEMVEAGLVTSRHSIAEEGGYGHHRSQERIKARKILSGLEEGEQVGFVTPSPIDQGIFEFMDKYASDLISALGGASVGTSDFVNSASLSQTFAAPIATAGKRALSYITYGLAELLQLTLEMAVQDGLIPPDAPPRVYWRYKGDVFPDTPQSQLTKSIVSRNLIRLGVNLQDAMQHIFPDKREEEIEDLLDNGFAYELLNGVSQVTSSFQDPEIIEVLKNIVLQEVRDARGIEPANTGEPESEPESEPTEQSTESTQQ